MIWLWDAVGREDEPVDREHLLSYVIIHGIYQLVVLFLLPDDFGSCGIYLLF